jgi:hypothetical protein
MYKLNRFYCLLFFLLVSACGESGDSPTAESAADSASSQSKAGSATTVGGVIEGGTLQRGTVTGGTTVGTVTTGATITDALITDSVVSGGVTTAGDVVISGCKTTGGTTNAAVITNATISSGSVTAGIITAGSTTGGTTVGGTTTAINGTPSAVTPPNPTAPSTTAPGETTGGPTTGGTPAPPNTATNAAPLLASTSLSNNSALVPVAQPITLTFDKAIKYVGGAVTLKAGSANPVAIPSEQIVSSGNTLSLALTKDLDPKTAYVLDFSGAQITDSSGAAFVPAAGNAVVSFTTANIIYATPTKGDSSMLGLGTAVAPYESIGHASRMASPGDTIYVVNLATVVPRKYNITAIGTQHAPITIKPAPNSAVKYSFNTFSAWDISTGDNLTSGGKAGKNSQYVVIEGFEFYGSADAQDHWDLVATGVWVGRPLNPMGGIAIDVKFGSDITIRDNYFHDLSQKAVNISGARYVNVVNNIIRDVATKSLSGGHGVMRQQGPESDFGTPDDAAKYRWDINGNFIFNVSQRIYSWVPAKGYMNMTLDEGKPILIDETKDLQLKARIANNIVAYAAIDSIRIKPTANLEVRNNSVYTTNPHADGITDINTLSNLAPYSTNPMPGLIITDNLVSTASGTFAFELNDSFPTGQAGVRMSGNLRLGSSGSVNPDSLSGVQTFTGPRLFVNPDAGDFTPAAGVAVATGVPIEVRQKLASLVKKFNVTVASAFWETDHVKLTQTMLDNIPGVDDGVLNNESVFTNSGIYGASETESNPPRMAMYFSTNATWFSDKGVRYDTAKRKANSPYNGLYEIIVPEDYAAWLDAARINYPGYSSIRHGNSYIAQTKVMPANSLLLTKLTSATQYEQILAAGQTITTGGDLRVVLAPGFVPSAGQTFDIISAANIVTGSAPKYGFADVVLPPGATLVKSGAGLLQVKF